MGTIALVILSLLILPQILKNKHAVKPQEPVVIMPEQEQLIAEPLIHPQVEEVAEAVNDSGFNTEVIAENLSGEYGDEVVHSDEVASKQVPELKTTEELEKSDDTKRAVTNVDVKNDKNVQASDKTAKATEKSLTPNELQKPKPDSAMIGSTVKVAKEKPLTTEKANVNKAKAINVQGYAVQLGVFADPENVKKMQAKIALAGFESKTSSVPQGTRLRVGYFVSKQGAEQALETLKQNGLSGKIVAR